MLRASSSLALHICDKQFSCLVRSKATATRSILTPNEKIKRWNKENKDMFGPLLETSKEKRQRLKKTTKNSSPEHNRVTKTVTLQNDKAEKSNSTETISCLSSSVFLKGNMWSNLKHSDKMASLFNVSANVRFIKSVARNCSAVQPVYPSDDKILQIRPHQNDYAQQYPSVTLILNKTMTDESKTALEKWKQERIAEIGVTEFNKFYQNQMAVGTKFHTTLKNYFTQPLTQLRIDKEVEGVWSSVSELLKNITSPKAIESNVVHPVLKYRGIIDAIAEYEERPTLIEWKKSDKPRKSISMTFDNPVQLAAYFGAVCNDLNYKHFNVRDALLVIAYTDGSKADVYHLSTEKLREHWAQWLIRLESYMEKHGDNVEKKLKGGKRLFEEDIEHL